eukprot:scaffold177592_cov21-Tisochrysis_lutea.AAC.2
MGSAWHLSLTLPVTSPSFCCWLVCSITVSGPPPDAMARSLTARISSNGQGTGPTGLQTGPIGSFRVPLRIGTNNDGAASGCNRAGPQRRLQKFASYSGDSTSRESDNFAAPSIVSLKEFSMLGYGGTPAAPP